VVKNSHTRHSVDHPKGGWVGDSLVKGRDSTGHAHTELLLVHPSSLNVCFVESLMGRAAASNHE
jgi:hypothetical protein